MMKREPNAEADDMLPEYDFTGKKGVRGKYHLDPHQEHRVEVVEEDGTVTVYRYPPIEEGVIVLSPDVRAFFPTSESVNAALRDLIDIARKNCPGRE